MLPWPCVVGAGVCVRFVRSGQVEWCLTRGLLYLRVRRGVYAYVMYREERREADGTSRDMLCCA